MTVIIAIFPCWLAITRSFAAEQAGRLHGEEQNHRRKKGEVETLREQRFAKIVSETDGERADRGAAERAHAADDDHREGERQHLEIEPGIDPEKRAADHTAECGKEGAER